MWWNTFYKKFRRNETLVFAKYIILFWTPSIHYWERLPFGNGQEELFKKKCDFMNCYFTDERRFFGDNLQGFDAIIFNGVRKRNERTYLRHLPKHRYQHQKYIYLSSEPAYFYTFCSKAFDNFFNWTYTYKLDSDIVIHYLKIETREGKIIYPQQNMHWINATQEVSPSFKAKLKSKKKAVAWFVSHCNAPSKRDLMYKLLNNELITYNLHVDVYGKCGKLRCSNEKNYRNCYTLLRRDYYFYLAFENAISEDYVTEKVLHALLNRVVPIVYGGANYSRFLPPGSYLDLRVQPVQEVALIIRDSIKNPDRYASFFKWTNYYRFLNNGSGVTYSDIDVSICEFCKLMNDPNKFGKYSNYEDIRQWWYPGHQRRCREL